MTKFSIYVHNNNKLRIIYIYIQSTPNKSEKVSARCPTYPRFRISCK